MIAQTNLKTTLEICLFLLILAFPATAHAKIIYVDDDAPGADNGSSWPDAYNYLQDALAAAQSGDEIRVAEGIYKPDEDSAEPDGSGDRAATFQIINDVDVKGGYAGAGKPEPNARDIALYETILSGDLAGNDKEVKDPCGMLDDPTRAENSQHVVTGSGTNITAILDGFTITGGNATDPVNKIGENYWGAGMNNRYGSPAVNNCTFRTNSARNGGGGMNNFNSSPAVTNCTFSKNAARGGGSGMENYDYSSPIIINCAFSANYSINHGAAMHNSSGSNPTLVNCLFNENAGRLGGAMYNSSYMAACDPTLINCTFSSNMAVLSGGGIHNREGSSPALVNCILWGNSDSSGTGESAQIYSHSGSPVINHSCIQGWTGTLGGTGNIGLDPLFADAANADYHLQPGSPCFDAGDNSAVPTSVLTDLEGNPRVKNGIVDMGAYETPLTIFVDMDATGANNGSYWTDAYNYLQDALIAASYGDEIRVAQGIYKPDQGAGVTAGDRDATFQLVTGVTLEGGYAGFGEQDPDLRNIELYETILTGDLNGNDPPFPADEWEDIRRYLEDPCRDDNSYSVVTASGIDPSAVIEGFTITAGHSNIFGQYGQQHSLNNATIFYSSQNNGGGMYNDSGSPTIKHCTFLRNTTISFGSDTGGAGIFNINSHPILLNCNFIENIVFSGDVSSHGGGMFNINSHPTLTKCVLRRNVVTGFDDEYYGGGMYNYNSSPKLTDCAFIDNLAEYSSGGAVYNYNNSNPILTGCTFRNNESGGCGGAMFVSGGDSTLRDCLFYENTAYTSGGGMCIGDGLASLTNCIFKDNKASNGGAISNSFRSSLKIDNCTFIGNSAGDGGAVKNGGAWYNDPNSITLITNCVFSNNSGYLGGGIYNGWNRRNLTVINCTFTGNVASRAGGGIYNYGLCEQILKNCTFTGNSAPEGNALASDLYWQKDPSNLKITNCIFWNGEDGIRISDNSNVKITYSDVKNGWPGEGNIDDDPSFIEPGYWDANGVWIDGDYHLLPDSPCINTGDPNYIPEPDETDLDGKPRIIGGRIDIGAYESPLHARARIVPRTINLASKGKWIMCHISIPECHNVVDIDPDTVFVDAQIKAESVLTDERQQVATAAFNREDVQAILQVGEVEIKITGRLTDGNIFEGTDTIKVTDKAGEKPIK